MSLSMSRWRNKVAIVTGASVGIGAAIAQKLVEDGMQVVGLARRKELIDQAASKLDHLPGKLHGLKVDMANEKEIIAAFEWTINNLGPIHVLVNNAGILLSTSIIDGESDKWRNVFDVNVISLCVATREAVRNMRKNKIDGHIIQVSSLAAYEVSDLIPNANVYAASKHAVRAANTTIRMELQESNLKIKVSCISPGPVDTDIVTDFRKKHTHVNEVFNDAIEASDVADAVRYALSTPPKVQIQDIIMRPVSW